MLTPVFAVLMPAVLGTRVSDLQPAAHIGQVRAPVLVVSGTADSYTQIGETQALFARAPEPKSFWAVEGAGHVDPKRFGPTACTSGSGR